MMQWCSKATCSPSAAYTAVLVPHRTGPGLSRAEAYRKEVDSRRREGRWTSKTAWASRDLSLGPLLPTWSRCMSSHSSFPADSLVGQQPLSSASELIAPTSPAPQPRSSPAPDVLFSTVSLNRIQEKTGISDIIEGKRSSHDPHQAQPKRLAFKMKKTGPSKIHWWRSYEALPKCTVSEKHNVSVPDTCSKPTYPRCWRTTACFSLEGRSLFMA